MKILIIARVDHSGAGYALREAINRYTAHTARAIVYRRSKLQYPYDILNPSQSELNRLVRWANVINVHDEALQYIKTNKKIVTTYHGTWYRRRYKAINQRHRKYRATCLTVDLAILGPTWIGRAMEPIKPNRSKEFTIVHAPTQRHRKGTAMVVKNLVGLPLDVIEGVTNNACLKRKARGHVLIDQVGAKGLGYGTNAIEAWAMGTPVISSCPDRIATEMQRRWGVMPFIRIKNGKELRENVLRLRDDSAFYTKWVTISSTFYLTYHKPQRVAERFITVCGS